MAKFTLFRSTLLILCLGAANLPAQEPNLIPPPIPSVIPPEPPDPETLPAPPQLEWEPLGPKDEGGEGGGGGAIYVPPPEPETPIAPPPPPMVETPLPGGPDAGEVELAKPDVEIWRAEGDFPQIPARRSNRLDVAYMTGAEPVWLRVQFAPQAAGKSVYVRPGFGMSVNPPQAILTVLPSGECLVLAQLANGVNRSHLIFYCEGVSCTNNKSNPRIIARQIPNSGKATLEPIHRKDAREYSLLKDACTGQRLLGSSTRRSRGRLGSML